jgi:2-polyprenyl-3-methyl-5-hydroxy-6-metoxy-1,4-benzoquinol methylase
MTIQTSYREKKEEEYHNLLHKEGIVIKGHLDAGEKSYYKFFYNLIGNIYSQRILEIGCGQGWLSMKLAKEGAIIHGIDISGETIKTANSDAERQGIQNAMFSKMSIEDLKFEENIFDIVIGSAILHHTDIHRSIENIHKVLKPGGRAIFVEPLNENIVLKIWRMLTPWRRSPTEKALLKNDLEYMRAVFPSAIFYYFGFISILSAGLLIYFRNSTLIQKVNKIMEKLDGWLIKNFPFLGPYSAVAVIELKKGDKL